MDNSFISKSSKISNETKTVVVVTPPASEKHIPHNKEIILWYGYRDDLCDHGRRMGYHIINTVPDVSSIIHVKALVLCDVHIQSYINILNFAVNYDIPVVWIHSHMTPDNWMWSFKICIVGKVDSFMLWRYICEMIG
jgi:hypothetical protein